MGAADDEFAGGVDVQDKPVVEEPLHALGQLGDDAGQQRAAHVVGDAVEHLAVGLGLGFGSVVGGGDKLVVLGRDDDGVYAHRTVLLVILHRYLRLGVGAQVGHLVFLAAQDGQFAQQQVREVEGERHVVVGLVAGVAEHHALVAGALVHGFGAFHAAVDVGRLFVYGREHAAGVAVELVFAAGVADAVDDPAGHLVQVDVGL